VTRTIAEVLQWVLCSGTVLLPVPTADVKARTKPQGKLLCHNNLRHCPPMCSANMLCAIRTHGGNGCSHSERLLAQRVWQKRRVEAYYWWKKPGGMP
jgi:hypothetical protein